MHRRDLIQRAGMAGVLAAGAAPAAHAQPVTRWRLASSFPRNLDILFGAAELFARKVGEMSGRRFQVEVHAAGELMPALGVLDGVQQGSIEACHTSGSFFAGKDPAFAIGSALPFGMNSRQLTAWMTEGRGLDLTRELYGRINAVNFPCGAVGAQSGGWFVKEPKTVRDFKGLKFRTTGLAGLVIERLGGVPQTLAWSDIRGAFEKGRIGAAEGISPYDDQKLGLAKLAPHWTYPGWWAGAMQLDLLINQKAFDALTPEYKIIAQAACAWVHADTLARYDARNPAALRQMAGADRVQAKPFARSVLDAALKASMEIFNELDGRNPGWKKMHDDYRAFQKDALYAARLTDAPFDAYLQTVPL